VAAVARQAETYLVVLLQVEVVPLVLPGLLIPAVEAEAETLVQMPLVVTVALALLSLKYLTT
jgi:hypothetical protein